MTQPIRLSRRSFLRAAFSTTVAGTLFSGGSLAYAAAIEPGWVDITHLTLRLPRLAAAFRGYRLLQISDLHADEWMDRARLLNAVELANQQQPDVIAITGDFVNYQTPEILANLVAALSQLTAPDGTVAVLGNHDHWTSAAGIRWVLAQSGVGDLSNTVYTLQRGADQLHICGVDDIWEGHQRLDQVLAQLPATGAAILLAHEPDYADVSAATERFDLQISGHSHGGQCVVPLVGPPILPWLGEKYPLGLYQVGSMLQYTNRGLGTVRPRVRFNCRPEITVLTLETV